MRAVDRLPAGQVGRRLAPSLLVRPLPTEAFPAAASLLSEGIPFSAEVLARLLAARAAAGVLPVLLGARERGGGPLLGAALLDPHRPVAGGRLFARVTVAPGSRGQGVGSALWEELVGRRPRGGPALSVEVDLADASALAVAARWGAVAYQRSLALELDLSAAAVRPASTGLPAGLTVQALRANSPSRTWRAAFGVYAAAASDLPDREGAPAPSYDMFRAQADHAPGVHVAWRAGQAVGLTAAGPDGPDEWYVFFTGTVASVRRTGVARALKASLHRAAAREGVRRLTTSTLDVNTPMLRLNASLGYRTTGGVVRLEVA